MTGYKPDGWGGTVAEWNTEWDRRQKLGLWDRTTRPVDKPTKPARTPDLVAAIFAKELEARH